MQIKKEREKYFKEIYEANADKIFRYVSSRVSGREEVLDLVQEIFYKFWQAVSQGKVISFPKTFLFKIAHNKVIDWYRKNKPESLDRMMEGDEGESQSFQVEDTKAEMEMRISNEANWVLGIIHKLPPQYSEAVKMRFVDDLSPQEMAEILNISPNAVSLRLNHALEKLREILKIKNE